MGMGEGLTEDELAGKLVRGMRAATVVIVDYDPGWPARYERHAARVRRVLGERVRLIEHIGSTSVPGLAAKPIVDIVLGVDDPDDEAAYLPDLVAAGYELRVREPGHRCLRGGEDEEPVNLHCYPPGHDEVRKYLVLREQLRRSDADRARYERIKRELATRQWRDINFYAEAKGPVIREILARGGSAGELSP